MAEPSPLPALLALYDESVATVYGYLVSRVGDASLAEDLTAQTYLAAVDSLRRGAVPELSVRWLIGVARHKMADHWRRAGREERGLVLIGANDEADDWDRVIDAADAHATLDRLSAPQRAALTLRYIDDLPVRDVAEMTGRSAQATEALLARARSAFRRAYDERSGDAG